VLRLLAGRAGPAAVAVDDDADVAGHGGAVELPHEAAFVQAVEQVARTHAGYSLSRRVSVRQPARVDVRAFAPSDVPFAASLLAARPVLHPLVAGFDPAAEIESLLAAGASGWVAPGGYLLAAVDGGEAWVQYAGHAARDAVTYRHLYAAASRDWVAAGARRHLVVMPDGDPVAGPAFADLAFGREHVFALASLASQPSGTPGVPVRVATLDDLDALRPMLDVVARHLTAAPVFSPRPASYYATLPDLYREDLAEPEVTYLVASVDGRDVGFASWEPMPARICVPPGAYALSHMAVLPDARGRGVGQALALAGLALARERGATVTWTDWRLTNLSAEPYWRTYGWVPYLVRMSRRVEPAPD
jgi:GNAT superfamily N-acetyltransferase